MASKTDRPEWMEFFVGHKAELGKALGVKVGKQLGCGEYGCAFAVGEDRVLKVTSDPHEAEFAALMAELGEDKAPGSVEIEKVVELKTTLPPFRGARVLRGTWGILQERVVPFRPPRGRYQTRTSATEKMIRYVGAEQFFEAIHQIKLYRDLAYHRLFEAAREPAEALLEYDWTSNLGATLILLHDRGMVLSDVHSGNLGWRTGHGMPYELVFFDPGATTWNFGDQEITQRFVANPSMLPDERTVVMRAAPRIAARIGERIDKALGRGEFGIAFLLESGRVMKVTSDKTEGHRAELAKGHPGAANVYLVENMTIGAIDLDVSVIVSEFVDQRKFISDYLDLDLSEEERQATATERARRGAKIQRLLIELSHAGEDSLSGTRGAEELYRETVEALRETDPITHDLCDLAIRMLEAGYPLLDLHAGNLGFRESTRSLVLLDFGAADVDVSMEGPWGAFVVNPGRRDVARIAEDHQRFIERIAGARMGEYLGGGSYGAAYASSDKTVMKVTGDISEAVAWERIEEAPPAARRGAAELYQIVHFEIPAEEFKGSVILTERLIPLNHYELAQDRFLKAATDSLYAASLWARDLSVARRRQHPGAQTLVRELEEGLDDALREVELLLSHSRLRPLAELVIWMAEQGHALVDVAPRNLGWREAGGYLYGELVLFDPGGELWQDVRYSPWSQYIANGRVAPVSRVLTFHP